LALNSQSAIAKDRDQSQLCAGSFRNSQGCHSLWIFTFGCCRAAIVVLRAVPLQFYEYACHMFAPLYFPAYNFDPGPDVKSSSGSESVKASPQSFALFALEKGCVWARGTRN